jgi:hypothetical protein
LETKLTIREACAEDVPTIREFILRMLKLDLEFDPLRTISPSANVEQLIRNCLEDPKSLLLVALLDCRPAGALREEVFSRRL